MEISTLGPSRSIMKLAALSDGLSLNQQRVHEWTSAGIVLPIIAPMGRGKHSEYDDVSLVAAAIAQELDELNVVVRRYTKAFAQLHLILRTRSSLEWSQMWLDLTPIDATLIEFEDKQMPGRAVIRLNLTMVCRRLNINQHQQPLNFGLKSA